MKARMHMDTDRQRVTDRTARHVAPPHSGANRDFGGGIVTVPDGWVNLGRFVTLSVSSSRSQAVKLSVP